MAGGWATKSQVKGRSTFLGILFLGGFLGILIFKIVQIIP